MKRTLYILFLVTAVLCAFFSPELQCAGIENTNGEGKIDSQSIKEGTFLNIFKEYIFQHAGKKRSDIIISRFKVSGNRPIPQGRISVQIFEKNQQKLEGYVRLTALIKVKNITENTVRLSGWIDIFDHVVCSKRNMKRGEILTKDAIYLARKNISRMPKNIFSDTDRVIGLRLKNNIRAETCLKEWMLEKNPAVEKGDIVTIIAESGFIRVETPGLVLDDGYVGDVVSVRNSMSERNIYAKIINNSTVMVNF